MYFQHLPQILSIEHNEHNKITAQNCKKKDTCTDLKLTMQNAEDDFQFLKQG